MENARHKVSVEEIVAIAKLHARVLPDTWSSKFGSNFLAWLYKVVGIVGYVDCVRREGKIVGVMSGIGKLILTLIVDPKWQRQGIGRGLLTKLDGRQYVYTQASSVEFYEKMGFGRVGQIGSLIFLCRK